MTEAELFELAKEADKNDMPATAVELFRQIIAQGVARDIIKFRLADNLRELGKLRECEEFLSGLTQVPQNKLWLVAVHWGQLFMDMGDCARAETKFREAARLNPGDTVPWVYLGHALAKQERFADAIRELLNGINAEGDLDEVYYNLGLYKRSIGDYSAACDFLEKALSITPEYPQAKSVLKDVKQCLRYRGKDDN